jgi:hypothetical protein
MRNPYLMSEEEDPQLLGTATPSPSQQMPPVPIQSPPAKVINQDGKTYEFSPGSNGALTVRNNPPSSTSLIPPPQNKAVVIPGMPPNVQPDDIAGYLSSKRKAMNQFGAEDRMNLQNSLNKRRNSFGYKATEGLKGLADSIMMGVAGAGNPGWQQQFQQGEEQNAQNQINALKDEHEMNMESVQGGMSLDQMNPASPLSKMKQESYAPLFQKLGYQPDKLQGMSAANIDNALALMAQFGGAEVQAMIKQYELDIERTKMATMAGRQASEEELARLRLKGDADKQAREAEVAQQKMKADAAAELLKRGGENKTFMGVSIPFTRANTDETEAAKKVLMQQLEGGTTEQTKAPPYGQTVTRDGIEYEWSSQTGKYHRKK